MLPLLKNLERLLDMTHGEKVKKIILQKALEVYKKDPSKLTNSHVARELNTAHSRIHYHFGDMLKEAVLNYAVEQGDSRVIVQLIASDHHLVKDMTDKEKQLHFKSI